MDPKSINVHHYLLTKGRAGKKQTVAGAPNAKAPEKLVPRDVTNVVRAAGSATPANVKRKQIMKQSGFISSPTDSVLSPCSQKLWKRDRTHDVAGIARFNLAAATQDDEEENKVTDGAAAVATAPQ